MNVDITIWNCEPKEHQESVIVYQNGLRINNKFGEKFVFLRRRTRPNWARKVREMILFSVLCTVYCGRGCVSLESEYGKELA